ncbi:unnamed protein product, partial [Ectocarpus sp. 4 AP-2014]
RRHVVESLRRCKRQTRVRDDENARPSRNPRGLEIRRQTHAGVENTLADGISRCASASSCRERKHITKSDEWRQQPIGKVGERLCDIVLQTENIAPRHDNLL